MAGARAARDPRVAGRLGGADHLTRIRFAATIERWPVAGAFTIARGAKTHVDVVVAEARADGAAGRGEATPIYYHGETAEGVAAAVAAIELPEADWRSELPRLLPRGAARNAADAALHDLEARRTGMPVWRRLGLEPPAPLVTAFTISLGQPERMEADAREAAGRYPLLKLKLAGDGDLARVAAVRRGAPGARLIVDANEAWSGRDVAAEAARLVRLGVELIEQPVRAGEEAALDGVASPIPLCADESCQDRADLARCLGRFQAINVKLDKAGGLGEALALIAEARAAGLEVMVGCMLGTSLGMAPAFLAAQGAKWADLDGPLLLAKDRANGFRFDNGAMSPARLWGEG